METIRITTSQNVAIDYDIASLGERIVARLIDYALLIVLALLGIFVAALVSGLGTLAFTVIIIIVAVFACFYDLVCELLMNGQSLGKRLMKIRVISLDGGQATLGQYLLRWLLRIVDFTLSGESVALICVAVTDKKQRVGDIVAGTIVIKTQPRTTISEIAFAPIQTEDYVPVYREVLMLNDREIELIYEVINSYRNTGNATLVYNMAARVKEHLSIDMAEGMHELAFLQTIVKDYNVLSAQQH